MAMTNDELGSMLSENGFEFEKDDGYFWGFIRDTRSYRDSDGDAVMHVVVQLTEDGRFIRFIAPELYDLSKCRDRTAAMEAALATGYRTKSINYEFDPTSGELRAVLEFPLGNAVFTEKQVSRCIGLLSRIVDAADPVIRRAIDTGKVDWSIYDTVPADADKRQMAELLERVGGIEGLRKLAAQAGKANGKSGK